jgi:hypothetical protein
MAGGNGGSVALTANGTISTLGAVPAITRAAARAAPATPPAATPAASS